MSNRHHSILTLMKSGATFSSIDIIYMIYLDVKYFSVVCPSIYHEKITVKTTLTTMRHSFEKKLNFCSSNIILNSIALKCQCSKHFLIHVSKLHFKISNSLKRLKQIPKIIEKCLSQLSSNVEIFNESAPFYEDKLHQSGYQQKLKYNPVNTKTHCKCNHNRNIIWFNPPSNQNVSTKIDKYFF